MLQSISWKVFLITILTLIAIYYFAILFLYYKKEILRILNARPFVFELKGKTNPFSSEPKESTSDTKDTFSFVHDLMEELKQIFLSALKNGYHKEELVMALQILLRDYQQLKQANVYTEINNHIATRCKDICSISLSDDELNMLWNG